MPLPLTSCRANTIAEVGRLSTAAESRSHFGIWSIISAPLVLGFDLRDQKVLGEVWDIITNKEAIRVNHAWHGLAGNLTKTWAPSPPPGARGPELSIVAEPCKTGKPAPSQSGWSFESAASRGEIGSVVWAGGQTGSPLCVDTTHAPSGGSGSSTRLLPCLKGKSSQAFSFNHSQLRPVAHLDDCLNIYDFKGPSVIPFPCAQSGVVAANTNFTFSETGRLEAGFCKLHGQPNCMAPLCMTAGPANAGLNQIWTKPLGKASLAVLAINGGDANATLTVSFADLPGVTGPQHVRDIWDKTDLGVHDRELQRTLESHDSLFVILNAASTAAATKHAN